MAENKDTSNENEKVEINSTNIFEEFENDQKMASEVEEIKTQENKDKYYYMLMFSKISQKILLLGVFLIFFMFVYIFIQTDDKVTQNTYLKPICSIFTGDIEKDKQYCSSVSFIENKLDSDLKTAKEEYSKDILNILSNIYKTENFTKTKEVSFIDYKTKNKLEFTEFLKKFNDLKVGFDGVAKDRVQCKDYTIEYETKTLTANCYAYSKGYEDNTMIGDSGNKNLDKESGTSISLANSFLNYIEKNSNEFSLIDRQKIFKKDNVAGEVVGFTYKTNFKLKLKYNF